MTGWLGSGVKGKMDRIFKPSPGKILVSDKLGNAVESGVSINDLAELGGGNSSTLNNSEPYQQVYSLQVTGSATQQPMLITDEDLGGQYKDILIQCVTPQAPSINMGGDPSYIMRLYFMSGSDSLLTFSDYNLNSDLSSSFFFVYQFLNDGGIIRGKQGKTKLTNIQTSLIFNDTLTEVFPFSSTVDETVVSKEIIIGSSLPINSILLIYARNKINL